jgi:hypothetical protein
MPPRSLYFVNGWVDWLALGGLSILTAIALVGLGGATDGAAVKPFMLPLAMVLNYPHFSATIYRLYQNPHHLREFPVTALGLPVLLFLAVIAGLSQPELIGSYLIMLYLLWSPYHYSGQTVGLTMVYARRAGFRIGRRERLALSSFVFSAFLCGAVRMQQAASENGLIDNSGFPVPAFTFPEWLSWAAQAVMVVGALLFCGFAIAWCLREQRLLPPIVLLPAATHFIWFVPGAGLKGLWLLVPAFHSLQYLLVALFVQLKRRGETVASEYPARSLAAEMLRWGLANTVGGALLFVALPVVFIGFGYPSVTAFGVVWAAVNIHHFFVDGVIWKLREPATVSALTTSLAELGRPALLAPARA